MSHFRVTFTERYARLTDFYGKSGIMVKLIFYPLHQLISHKGNLCLQYTILQTPLSHISKVIKTTTFPLRVDKQTICFWTVQVAALN